VALVAALLLTVAFASTARRSTSAQEASPAATPAGGIVESTIAVAGRGLHLARAGTGSPPVLFEPGGPFLDGGAALVAEAGPDLAAALGTRFCSYDRAGTGQSDPYPAEVRTFTEAAADLKAVLAAPELGCPCVVVGESLGGSIALVALAEDVAGFAGLVLLDPPYPGYFAHFLAIAPPDSPELESGAQEYYRGANEEGLDLEAGFGQVTAPAAPPPFPVVVVTHGVGDPPPCFPCSATFPVAELETAWQAGQADLARALGARLVVAENTGHSIANENPELVIGLTAEVIAAVLDPSTWATPAASPAA